MHLTLDVLKYVVSFEINILNLVINGINVSPDLVDSRVQRLIQPCYCNCALLHIFQFCQPHVDLECLGFGVCMQLFRNFLQFCLQRKKVGIA